MQAIQPGVAARVQGAFGTFLTGQPAAPQFWVAGGIGVTPFLGVLRSGVLGAPTTLLYLHRTDKDAAFLPELRAVAAASPLLTLRDVATDDALPDLERLVPDARQLVGRECYLCGPPGLVAALKPLLRRHGAVPRHIHFESFELR